MQYAILIYEDEAGFEARNPNIDAERCAEYMAPYKAYVAALAEAGVLAGGEKLESPATATTVRIKGGKREIQDGPFAASHGQLGGMMVIEVDNLDEALDWAAKCPAAAHAGVEVRPIAPTTE